MSCPVVSIFEVPQPDHVVIQNEEYKLALYPSLQAIADIFEYFKIGGKHLSIKAPLSEDSFYPIILFALAEQQCMPLLYEIPGIPKQAILTPAIYYSDVTSVLSMVVQCEWERIGLTPNFILNIFHKFQLTKEDFLVAHETEDQKYTPLTLLCEFDYPFLFDFIVQHGFSREDFITRHFDCEEEYSPLLHLCRSINLAESKKLGVLFKHLKFQKEDFEEEYRLQLELEEGDVTTPLQELVAHSKEYPDLEKGFQEALACYK